MKNIYSDSDIESCNLSVRGFKFIRGCIGWKPIH